MATKNEGKPSFTKDDAVVLSEGQRDYLRNYLPDRNAEPFPLAEITKAMGLTAPRMPAADLIDRPFVILAAKTFGSAFDPERHAYFCIIKTQDDGELHSTVLGGFAVTEILDAICDSDFREPLLVTMREVQGGKYGRYYVLE